MRVLKISDYGNTKSQTRGINNPAVNLMANQSQVFISSPNYNTTGQISRNLNNPPSQITFTMNKHLGEIPIIDIKKVLYGGEGIDIEKLYKEAMQKAEEVKSLFEKIKSGKRSSYHPNEHYYSISDEQKRTNLDFNTFKNTSNLADVNEVEWVSNWIISRFDFSNSGKLIRYRYSPEIWSRQASIIIDKDRLFLAAYDSIPQKGKILEIKDGKIINATDYDGEGTLNSGFYNDLNNRIRELEKY